MDRRNQTPAILSMLLVMLIWGSTFAITREAVSTVPPITFAFLRFVIASVTLLLLYVSNRSRFDPKETVPLRPVFWMGLCGVGLFYPFFNLALVYTSASSSAMLQAFIPVVISLLAFFFLKEKLSAIQRWGIFFSVIGVGIITLLNPKDESLKNPLLGSFFNLLSVICWAVYTIISKKISNNNVIKVTAYSTWIGTGFLLPAAVIELWGKSIPAISWPVWISLLYLGAAASAFCYLLYNNSLKTLPASLVGIFINLDPVVGAGIAVSFLREKISLWQVAGVVIIIASMWLTTRKKAEKMTDG